MTAFKHIQDCFSGLAAGTVADLVAESADLSLVLDAAGVVQDLSIPSRELVTKIGASDEWIGQAWAALLVPASRAKAAQFLAEAIAGRKGKWLHLKHAGADGTEIPILYAAALLDKGGDKGGRLLLLARDLRPLAMLQQRLIDAQHVMQRDHGRIRQLELRWRLLMQIASDPLLLIDAANHRIIEVNPALVALLGLPEEALIGQPGAELFSPADRARVAAVLAGTRTEPGSEQVAVAVRDGARVIFSAFALREETEALLLVRLHTETAADTARFDSHDEPALLRLLDRAPDAYVVTDAEGHVFAANAAFLAMTDLTRPGDVIGQPLDRWLGRGGADLDLLLANLRQRGAVRLFSSAMTGAADLAMSVEVSGVALGETGDKARFGFAIRDVERRVVDSLPRQEMPRSVDQLTELIGRVPLKDLVREATDMIERLCIEAALGMTRDNRASAAELLGLSRQSLYVKLHRYGLGDLAEAQN